MTSKADTYFASATRWHDEQLALRDIVLDCPVTEEFKWRSPCYCAEGGNIVLIGSLKEACTLSFLKGVLLTDPKGILEPPGENSRSARIAKFTSVADIEAVAADLKALVLQAIDLEKAGEKVTFAKDDLDHPGELTDRLSTDAALKAAFEALTPGRRRGYLLHFSQAKQSKTRADRIEKWAPRILAGKGMHDR